MTAVIPRRSTRASRDRPSMRSIRYRMSFIPSSTTVAIWWYLQHVQPVALAARPSRHRDRRTRRRTRSRPPSGQAIARQTLTEPFRALRRLRRAGMGGIIREHRPEGL